MTRPGQTPARVREAHVSWLAERLGERDRAILGSVARLRLTSSIQLERLHFTDIAPASRARLRRRVLARLVAWRVLVPLARRIGGVRAGSAGLVFALDTAGQYLAQLTGADGDVRRSSTPGVMFVQHTLAVSELYVSLMELARPGGFQVATFEAEPRCWWPNGLGGWLKPDAYLVLAVQGYADAWWLEQDMGTEHLPTIRRKLSVYLDFVKRGQQGPISRTVPRVLVAVPNEARQRAIETVIRRLPEPASKLFHVATTPQTPSYLLRVLRE